jgi:hypothetical protein
VDKVKEMLGDIVTECFDSEGPADVRRLYQTRTRICYYTLTRDRCSVPFPISVGRCYAVPCMYV